MRAGTTVIAGVMAGWFVGSLVAALLLSRGLGRLGARDHRFVPVGLGAGGAVPEASPFGDDGDVAAVLAHALLGSMSIVAGAAHTLERSFDVLTPAERRAVVERLVAQADHVMGVLGDVARGLPAGVHDLLDGHGTQAVTSRRATRRSDTAAATAT